MSAVRRIFFIFFSVLLWVLLGTSAYADNIMRVRAFSNSDKTRVVLDLDFEPTYSTALNDNGASFVVRVNDVDNYRSAPASLELESRSVIKKFTKNLSGDDVRYIFDLQGSGTPNVFVLKPMDGRNYRLVLDFPNTA